jgi:hypothetical protein
LLIKILLQPFPKVSLGFKKGWFHNC